MAFGHYIRCEREGQAMTLTELARRVEVSIAYLSRIERERENPPRIIWSRRWPALSASRGMICLPRPADYRPTCVGAPVT
jgi:predicted transcriptional regulator